jgi:hypothetical protein
MQVDDKKVEADEQPVLATTASLTPTLLPSIQSNFSFDIPFYIGNFTGGAAGKSINRDLLSPTLFPDHSAIVRGFANVLVTSKVDYLGQRNVGCVLELVPDPGTTGMMRVVSYVRPAGKTGATELTAARSRPGSALCFYGASQNVPIGTMLRDNIRFTSGTSQFLKSPVNQDFLPRFDFFSEGTSGAKCEVFLHLIFSAYGQGYPF